MVLLIIIHLKQCIEVLNNWELETPFRPHHHHCYSHPYQTLNSTRVGVVTYGGQGYDRIWLDDPEGWDKVSLQAKIDGIIWEDQSTNTSGGNFQYVIFFPVKE